MGLDSINFLTSMMLVGKEEFESLRTRLMQAIDSLRSSFGMNCLFLGTGLGGGSEFTAGKDCCVANVGRTYFLGLGFTNERKYTKP